MQTRLQSCLALCALGVGLAPAQAREYTRGAYVIVSPELTDGVLARIRSQIATAQRSGARTVILEIRPGQPSYGACHDLARYVSDLPGLRTVAFLPAPVRSHAVLVALACDEIVMASKAAIGVVAADEPAIPEFDQAAYQMVIQRKSRQRQRALIKAMLNPHLKVIEIRTADGDKRYVTATELEAESRRVNIVQRRVVVESDQAAVYTAAQAAEYELATLILDTPQQVVRYYELDPAVLVAAVQGGEARRAALIELSGPVDKRMVDFLNQNASAAVAEGHTLLIFRLDSPGGLLEEGQRAANLILDLARQQGVRTVAFLSGDALSAAAMIALACQQIAMRPRSRLGDCGAMFMKEGRFELVPEEKILGPLRRFFDSLAEANGWDPVLLQAMVAKNDVVLELADAKGRRFLRQEEFDGLPPAQRAALPPPRVLKPKGEFLTVNGTRAVDLGLAQIVVDEERDLLTVLGLDSVQVPVIRPSWVDGLANFLTDPLVVYVLWTFGLMGLYVELSTPGFGVPGTLALVCFGLFFWAMWWAHSVGILELILLVIGVSLLLIELFLTPGFGVPGVAGIACLLGSLVLAMHTFVIPRTSSEFAALGRSIGILLASLLSFIILAALTTRYLPRAPVLRRFMLAAPAEMAFHADAAAQEALGIRTGQVGRASTVLRPAGKARFGDQLVDVTTEGTFIEPGTAVEVLEVKGNRIVVKARKDLA